MSRRLTADTKIVLERAGYRIEIEDQDFWVEGLLKGVWLGISIENCTVDNAHVVDLLEGRGYDEFGYRRN